MTKQPRNSEALENPFQAAGLSLGAPTTNPSKECDLCCKTTYRTLCRQDRHGNPLETAICDHCGLISHAKIPTEAELSDFYAHRYRKSYHGQAELSPRRIMRAWKKGQRVHGDLAKFLPRSTRLFEVGAGLGCTIKIFELDGFETSGIEPGRSFQNFAQEKILASVSSESLFDLPPIPQFDVILLIHVIEHFASPRRALKAIHQLLHPGGQLYVECPNVAGYFATPKRWFHYAHVHNFTPWTLTALAKECGFEVHQRWGNDESANLKYLLTRSSTPSQGIDVEELTKSGFEKTIEALKDRSFTAYHFRKSYLKERAKKLQRYLVEMTQAKRFVQSIVTMCQEVEANRVDPTPLPTPLRRAA
ncbi:Class I SAM-dependent methyltransferase [Planctomycetales bacterium 10988]|nr:Class I SAM-dependent methyltransferase [Planctomycetales bacterium 10988]